MKKLSLLFAIALIIPASISCSEDNNRNKNLVFAGVVVLVGGALTYKYWWNKTPEAPTLSADNPTPNINNINPLQDNQEHITPPTPAIPLNKLIPVPGISDEDHKAVENALNASKKPTDTNAKPISSFAPSFAESFGGYGKASDSAKATSDASTDTPTYKQTEQPKILTPNAPEQRKQTSQIASPTTKTLKSNGFSLSDAFEKISNRANPDNIDHATNDYINIIMGY